MELPCLRIVVRGRQALAEVPVLIVHGPDRGAAKAGAPAIYRAYRVTRVTRVIRVPGCQRVFFSIAGMWLLGAVVPAAFRPRMRQARINPGQSARPAKAVT
ncbi:hypothetical protein [Streptomyces sp. NBC_01508]|uniref:hypothetical protein n=1 Tax=Streptomyces sp. NBC_01508 TaxID=2903888 RepID=UPI003863525E